jgi:microcystin-dependent protein
MKNAAVSCPLLRSPWLDWVPGAPGGRLALASLSLAVALLVPRALAQPNPNPPERLTYQGFLVDGNGVALGNTAPKNYDLEFRLYNHETDSGSANLLWGEQQTVTLDKGYFSVLLGEGALITGVPHPDLSTLFRGPTASERWIGITVKGIGAGGANVNILPRLRLLSSPYAFLASQAVKVVRSDTGADLISSSANAVTVNGTVTASSFAGNGTIPLGGIIMWSGSTAPPGWALCNGQNGTPDLRGRFVLGAGAGTGLTARDLGQMGGVEAHTLTAAEMPAHNHPTTVGTVGYVASWNSSREATKAPDQGRNNGNQTQGSAMAGGGQPHDNMPPYYVLAYIMRIQ